MLTLIGSKAYGTLRSLLARTLPNENTFKGHFAPKPLVISERFHFYRHTLKQTESIADFAADLTAFLDQALPDHFVCGVRSETIRRELLTKDGLTMAEVQGARRDEHQVYERQDYVQS